MTFPLGTILQTSQPGALHGAVGMVVDDKKNETPTAWDETPVRIITESYPDDDDYHYFLTEFCTESDPPEEGNPDEDPSEGHCGKIPGVELGD